MYLDELNQAQRDAVVHKDGPVLVIAGPGSGKTRVLTYRIVHLINSQVAPWEILALTFTNKSAKEMKERIAKVVGPKAKYVWAGTFHSIFAKLLRAEADKIGYNSNFTIYDTQDSHGVINEIVKQSGLDNKVYTPASVMSRISLAKNNLISPQLYKSDPNLLLQDKQAKRPEIYKIYDAYVNACKRNSAMDFDDLLYQMHALLLNNKDIADKLRQKFRYVMVDEFQDTNALQMGILRSLTDYPGSSRNICAVGDDAQSIYGFRGATIQNILEFERTYPGLVVYKLEHNYRSTKPIVQAANEVIANNRRQLQKTIFTEKEEGDQIKVLKSMTDEEEARRVVSIIQEQKHRFHLHNEDFAILYRTNAQSRLFEESLTNERIPYKVYGGLSFYQRKEIKDYVSYLRVALNPHDSEALKRIINFPRRGIGDATIDKIAAIASAQNVSLWDVLQHTASMGLTNRAVAPIQEFVEMVKGFIANTGKQNAYDFAVLVGRKSGLLAEYKKDTSLEGIGRFENVTSLLDGIKSFTSGESAVMDIAEPDEEETQVEQNPNFTGRSLADYLQNIALLTDADQEDGNADRVKLMSVHSAKGLEFRSVFVVGMEENIFPSSMSLQSENPLMALDEERRLFYVAITRAEQWLTLSYAASRYRFGKMVYNDKSRFLDEISAINLEPLTVRARSASGTPKNETVSPGSPPVRRFIPSPPKDAPTRQIVPSPKSAMKVGKRVLHEKFGEGEITKMDGPAENLVLTIAFEHPAYGEKRIMLNYAKLQVLD